MAEPKLVAVIEDKHVNIVEDPGGEVVATFPRRDAFAGYHTWGSGTSFEVFHVDAEHVQHSAEPTQVGWYWWPCHPGCLPDGDIAGPFLTAEGAYLDAIGD